MSWLPELIQDRLVIVLAHFVWQGVAVSAALFTLIALLNVKRPTARYASSLFAFVLLAACPIVTWFVVPTPGVRRLDAALHQEGERPVARVDVEVAQTDLPRDEIDERGVAWQDSLRPFEP